MMEAQADEDVRRAALVVHAMAGVDREWLLENLATPQRHRLESLLQELQTIGIPPAPGLLQDIQRASRGRNDERDAQAAALRRLLEPEPLRLTGAVLSLHDWPPAVRFAAGLDPQRRTEALVHVPDGRPAPAFRDALVRAVQQAVSEQLPEVKPKRSAWQRIAEVIRRRFA